jgi:DNA-binding PadR family transcriptional regulator
VPGQPSAEQADLGRYADAALLVLVSLSGAPRHGYGIMIDVQAFSGVSLGPGTLYAVLARLEGRGLIEALPAEDRRRPYRLTALGASALQAQLDSLGRFVRIGRERLRGAES